MERETDIVESLIRNAGRRAQPPEDAYRQVYVAAHAAFLAKAARRRGRLHGILAAAAAALVLAVAVLTQWTLPPARQGELARVARAVGEAEISSGKGWQPLAQADAPLAAGARLRTRTQGRVALSLAGGESLRLAPGTEVMFDAPGRVYLQAGTVYVDSGPRPAPGGIEIVTPAGTARDLGTQFELQVAGAALRFRVREGGVSVDRGGKSVTGQAGEQVTIDGLGTVTRSTIAPDDPAWQWAEEIAPMPDMNGKPASALIAWVARETGMRLSYESALAEQRAATVILHGDIRHLEPVEALEAMLATTDLTFELRGDTMEIRARSQEPPGP